MSDYLLRQTARHQPQTEQARSDQVENDAGGFVFAGDRWQRLRRFLILGSEGGDFYASEHARTIENIGVVRECLAEDGPATVAAAVDVSDRGLAPSNDPALYVVAAALAYGDKATKRAAAESLPKVARIGTHLYHFAAYAKAMRGTGRSFRWAVKNWYASKTPQQLAYDAVKYRQRDGWSHRDLFRLAHPTVTYGRPAGDDGLHADRRKRAQVHDFIVEGKLPSLGAGLPILHGYDQAQRAERPVHTANLIREFKLPREAVNTDHLTDPEVWRALLDVGMPLNAMTRNLANMTRHGVLTGSYLDAVTKALTDQELIRKSRLHPVALLMALRTYATGVGLRGTHTWMPIAQVIDALDAAFYMAFGNVPTTGKRILLGVDVSGSMSSGGVAGIPSLCPREAAAAMALVTLQAEPNAHVMGFTVRGYPLGYSRRQRLDDALRITPATSEGTDCATPIRQALADLRSHAAQDVRFDAIVMYTDNQTWAGPVHVHQAVEQYRQQAGVPTRMVACGMIANGFTVLDPTDPLSLNVVGFDASAASVIGEFVAGEL